MRGRAGNVYLGRQKSRSLLGQNKFAMKTTLGIGHAALQECHIKMTHSEI